MGAAAGPGRLAALGARDSSAHGVKVPRRVSNRPGIDLVHLVLPGIGSVSNRDGARALLAVAAQFGAGHAVGLGFGAAGGQLDRNGFSLGRVRHFDTSRQTQHTPAAMSGMSQMDYDMTLFESRPDP